MYLNELEKWGIPSRVIERWQKRQGDLLLPVQSRAVRKGLLNRQGNGYEWQSVSSLPSARLGQPMQPVRMIISAPTSSGKSFCAELAAMKALTARQKVVMLFPLKSLAEQKYELLENTYGDLGVKCLIVTGDHPENDQKFLKSDYQIAIVIYEKFDLLLTASLDALKNIGLIVIDEIQSIAEPIRGAILERFLTKILVSVYHPALIGLSAVIGDDTGFAGRLAQWLNAVLVEETVRPVELMRGVAAEGSFHYRLFNKGLEGSKPFVKREVDEKAFDSFIRQIKVDNDATLVFLKSRMETVDCAFKLAAAVTWPAARKALEKLNNEEPSFLIRSLRQALGRGVAFHNSDLSPYQRKVVEQAFIDKEVKVVFSTTTLAMGVNIAADTVYLETVKYTSGEYNRRPSLIPLNRAEFDNMTGRAGRLEAKNDNDKIGRAIILADSEFDRDILWSNYIVSDNNSQPMKSAFASIPLEDWLLNMIVTGLIANRNKKTLVELFRHTLYAWSYLETEPPDFELSLKELSDNKFITIEDSTGAVVSTMLGKAVAKTGLSVAEAVYYHNKLKEHRPETIAGWIALALSGPSWNLPPGILSRYERIQNAPLKMLYQHYDHLLGEAVYLVGNYHDHHHSQSLSYHQAATIKAWLLLEQWRLLAPIQKLEEQFQIHLGQILSLGETAAHLVSSIAELIGAGDREFPLKESLKDYAFSLRWGMPSCFRSIHNYFSVELNRSDYRALQKTNIETLGQFCDLPLESLRTLIDREDKLKHINDKIKKLKEEFQMETMNTNTAVHRDTRYLVNQISVLPELIEVDGTLEKERYLVKINNFPVRLTGKSFKYFTKLAWARVKYDSGWVYKEDIENGFNQARYLYRMKGEISAELNISWPIVENNRLGYYRLNIDPSKIRINIENLKNHPDYEIRSLVMEETTKSN